MPIPRLPPRGAVQVQLSCRRRPTRTQQAHQRLFSQISRLALVSHLKHRPQLPFLHPATSLRPTQDVNGYLLHVQLARFLSTETKQFLKYQAIQSGRYTVTIFLLLILFWSFNSGIQSILADQAYPSPAEWSYFTRFYWQTIRKIEEGEMDKMGFVNWAGVAEVYKKIIPRLEDPGIDGAGLRPILKDDGDIFVEVVGKTGLDVSEKSEEWRRGYFQCLMGAAKAAEKLDGMVADTGRKIAFPANSIIGPSNPNPRPLPRGSPPSPREEDVEPASESATVFYMRILTTHGFTSRQRLEAALAYADWLDSKGLTSTAGDMYDWGLDIAMGSLPHGVNESIDVRIGIISNNAGYISSNMLTASTALASHYARQGNLTAALPIFLSVLRARRQLPRPQNTATQPSNPDSSMTTAVSFLRSAFSAFPMPPPPPTGDETPERKGAVLCDEAGVMSNIGEVIFSSATSRSFGNAEHDSPAGQPIPSNSSRGHLKNQQAGLGWTREAADLAENVLEIAGKEDHEAQTRCSECLRNGMDNWTTMVAVMLKDERAAKLANDSRPKLSWLWAKKAGESDDRWENEANVVAQRLKSANKLLSKVESEQQQQKPFIAVLLGK